MEIHQMRYFRAVVEYGSFSEAAEHLHITQPALSKSISKLELELGTPLLERRGLRLSLTSAGRVLLPYCGAVLNCVESGITAVQESIGLDSGHLTIAVSTEIMIKHLIFRFLSEYPDVEFTCHLMSHEEMSGALAAGTVDFVISEQPVIGEHVQWTEIYRGSLTAVLPVNDPLLKKESISIADLKDHRFCIGHVRTNLYSSIFQLCNEAGFQPKIRYLGYDPDMAGMLLKIPGSVIISSNMIDRGVMQSGINTTAMPSVPIRGTENRSMIGIGMQEGHYQTKASHAFFRMLQEYYASAAD